MCVSRVRDRWDRTQGRRAEMACAEGSLADKGNEQRGAPRYGESLYPCVLPTENRPQGKEKSMLSWEVLIHLRHFQNAVCS